MPRLSFSQRMGLTPKEFPLQVDSLDNATRMDIWNIFYQFFLKCMDDSYLIDAMTPVRKKLCVYIWANLLKRDLSKLENVDDITGQVKEMIFNKQTPWYKVLDFCENLLQWDPVRMDEFGKELNDIFEHDSVGYRIVGGEIAPITNDQEIQAIKTAMTLPDQLAGARTHIFTALQLLSDREKPDYRNSIKESISAVESICKILAKDEHADLASAVKALRKKGFSLHGGLEQALLKIYGYTSDQGGIRHAMIEEGTVATQEDALFMLVSCSAFCHYLQQKGAQAGILS